MTADRRILYMRTAEGPAHRRRDGTDTTRCGKSLSGDERHVTALQVLVFLNNRLCPVCDTGRQGDGGRA